MSLAVSNDGTGQSRWGQSLHLAGVAAAGLCAGLLLVAYLIVSENLDEITSPILLTSYFLAASVAATMVLILLFWILPFRIAKLIALGIAAYALVSLAMDTVLPLEIGELEHGTESAPPAPLWGSVAQALGVVGLVGLLWKLPLALLGNLGWALAAIIVATTTVPIALQATAAPGEAVAPVEAREGGPPYNIYHVLFDGYYGPWLEWAIQELDLDPGTFAGFTHYRSARSNQWATNNSYPSFMSGTLYDSSQALSDWREAHRDSSLITDLNEFGFNTRFEALHIRPGFQVFLSADERYFEARQDEYLVGRAAELWMVLDFWAVRAAPVGFRHLLFQEGDGPFSQRAETVPLRHSYGYRSVQHFLGVLREDARRPATGEYVHVWVHPPHSPYTLDRHGRFIGDESSYEEEVLLVTGLMARMVERLKELSRYEDSFIIIQSDHGWIVPTEERYRGHPLLDTVKMDDETSERIAADSISGYSGREIDARYSALLLVKPPRGCPAGGSDGAMRVDDSLVQLLDLREFVVSVMSESNPDCLYPSHESVEIHVDRILVGGRDRNIGSHTPVGEYNRFRIHADGRWEPLPDLSYTYE